MPTKDEEIAALKALLKAAQNRADKAEKRFEAEVKKAKATERKLQAAEKKAEALEKELGFSNSLSNALLGFLVDYEEEILKHVQDLPDIQRDLWEKALKNYLSDYENIPAYRKIARFFLKGSEKAGKTLTPDQVAGEVSATNTEAVRTISTRTRQMRSAVSLVDAGACEAADEQPDEEALQTAKSTADFPVPMLENEERKPGPGRKAVEKFRDAPVASPEIPSVCPDCGSEDYEVSEVRTQQLRQIQIKFNDAIDHIVLHQRNGRCFKCGRVHHLLPAGQDIPVAPGRTIGQELAISLGMLYTKGLPLNRAQEMFANDRDGQLGHSTLIDNVHDWAMQTGKVLADGIVDHQKTQSTVIMDETTFTVLQSQGRGNCKLPDNARPRQKDYLAVRTSGFGEEHQCVSFKYLGGRKTEDIEKALEGFNNSALVTDAYAAYDSYVQIKGNVAHQCCCVHLRRMLLDCISIPKLNKALLEGDGTSDEKVARAIERVKNGFKSNQPAYYICSILSAMQKIYGLEKWLKKRPDETSEDWVERVRTYRSTQSTQLMDNVDVMMKHLAKDHVVEGDNQRFKPKNSQSLIGAAVSYYLNHRDNFRVFLENPLVEPDSSSAERCIRAVTVLRKSCDFKQSSEYMESLCVYFTLAETAKLQGFNDAMAREWLEDFGRAYYLHRANATLTHEVNNNGRKLENKLMGFNPDSAEGFDVEPWLPWNYLARRNQAD